MKAYVEAEIEIIDFLHSDIITASGDEYDDGDPDGGGSWGPSV